MLIDNLLELGFHISIFIGTYYFTAIIQAILHRIFGHRDRIHHIYVTHAHGHHGKYPPNRLLTQEWVESQQHVMWYYAIVFVPVGIIVAKQWGPWILLTHIAGLVFTIWWHIYLHKQYHLRGSRWEQFAWFQKKRELHFVHHRHVQKTFAIVEYWIDILLGTREEPEQPQTNLQPANSGSIKTSRSSLELWLVPHFKLVSCSRETNQR